MQFKASGKKTGFTLIELVIVLVLIAILAATIGPKYLSLKTEALIANMKAMKAALNSAQSLTTLKIKVNNNGLNSAKNRFTLPNGQTIRVRGGIPDGRWNNTFARLVDFENIAQSNVNNCTNTALKWCVRQRGNGWFVNRGYSTLGNGRGFIIFSLGYNVNQDRCYIYYLNQNNSATPATVLPSIVGEDFSEC